MRSLGDLARLYPLRLDPQTRRLPRSDSLPLNVKLVLRTRSYPLRIHPQLCRVRNVHRSGVRVDDLLIPDDGLAIEVKRLGYRIPHLLKQSLALGLRLLRSIL